MIAATLPLPGTPATTRPHDDGEPLYGGLAGLWRFTVADYQAMIRAGILNKYTPVELLNGLVVTKMSRGPDHDFAVRALTRRVYRMLPDTWSIGPQTAAGLDNSQPEPDLSVARGPDSAYADRHPGPGDLAWVVEVAASSITRDRREKLAVYAASGIPVYWVVNVTDRQVEVYTGPASDFYDGLVVYAPGQDVPVVLDGQAVGSIPAADLFR